ncbi:MAG: hypothetical protein ACE5GT_08610 [Rhodospirillales bacterium]
MSRLRAEMPDDCVAVIDAASALGVREIDLFRLAYRRWFGHEIIPAALERAFAAYMFRKIVPSWVRHFGRDVLARAAAGRLDPAGLGAKDYLRQPPAPRHGRLYVGLTAAAMVLYCVALLEISYDPRTSAPMPCYGGPGFKILSSMAHAVSGRAPPRCATPARPD